MKNISSTFLSAALTAGVFITGVSANAEDLAQTKTRQQASLSQGVGASSLPVLQRSGSFDPNMVSNTLIQKIRPTGTHQVSSVNGDLHVTGEQWALHVSSDGTAADYRDMAVESKAHQLGKPASQKMSETALEQKGRAFIAANLSSQISLGKGEQLIALRADYRSEGGQDLTTGKVTSAVVANRIVFGRMINGVPVVGNGSKVFVTFANDGSVESFRYDWPAYQATTTQNVVSTDEVLARVQKVTGIRNNETPTHTMFAPRLGSTAGPLALTSNSQLQSMECGYYDAGGSKGSLIQPGCTYLTVSKDLNGMRTGLAGAVPIGASFTADASWMETQILTAK